MKTNAHASFALPYHYGFAHLVRVERRQGAQRVVLDPNQESATEHGILHLQKLQRTI